MSRVAVLGGDGFCGWPTALHLSANGHDVVIIDNLSRRKIDAELDAQSLTPIAEMTERLATWEATGGRPIKFERIDIAEEYESLRDALAAYRPDTVIHFAEQRAAPYSMRSASHKLYTVDNNIRATHNLLASLTELQLNTHVVHLGTMGVYGYDGSGMTIPEGYLNVMVPGDDNVIHKREILYPTNPGSVYHMTKSMDQLLFQFYAKNDGMRVTDLHQGIVWGTQTEETRRHEGLINRFDYDGDYGTVLNRFLLQAAVGHPLTVHGTGGQTRAFIHIQDTVRCIALAVENPPARDGRVEIRNQMTETHQVRELALMVAKLNDAEVAFVDNPRKEAAENALSVSNKSFLDLGLNPITLKEGLLAETVEIAQKYASRYQEKSVAATVTWTQDQQLGVLPANAQPKSEIYLHA